jgi:MYXO-CTERM domain-containing protein
MAHARASLRAPRSIVLALTAATAFAACAFPATTSAPAPDPLGVAASAVTAAQAIANAEEWVLAKLLYCQSPNGADDTIDPSCPAVCMRESNPQWDPYRSDCSGLVSWAWGLPAPGRTTAELAPNETDITTAIDASTLQPADAVNTDDATSSDHHIMLFKEWTVPGQTATFIEEPGCAATPNYAHEFTSDVTLSGTQITVAYNGLTFTAIRYGALGSTTGAGGASGAGGSSSAPPACSVDGVDGTCIDTSVCATMPGYVATPGFCPGPADEQCCTPTSTTTTTTGAGSSGGATTGAGASSSGATSGGASSSGAHVGTGGASSGTPSDGAGSTRGASSGGPGKSSSGYVDAPSGTSGCGTSAPSPGSPLASAASLLAALTVLRRRKRSAVTAAIRVMFARNL